MSAAPYISLADYAAGFTERGEEAAPAYVHPTGPPVHLTEESALAERLEEILDTVVALQRADWLQDGVYLGPRAMGPVYRDLLECARTLGVAVPPAVVAGCTMSAQGAFGTNDRAFLLLSSFYLRGADRGERRFLLGRLCGHIHARQATWGTLYALLVDHNGIRRVGRRYLGPTLEVVLAPMSLGARLALSRWHRAAEITADRAGLLTCGDLDAARRALLRLALGVRPDVDPADYLDTLRGVRSDDSPARWTELLASQPWMHKRMQALELFARSETWAELGGSPSPDPLSRERLDQRTEALLRVR
jgi:hypothetical protein